MPVIILEGIDGSGKSTLAERLMKLSPVRTRILHRGPLEKTVEEELIYPLQTLPPDELLICDRWHVGEMIYGPIYRGKSQVEGTYQSIIEELLWDMGAVKVVMSPPFELVAERLEIRGEDYLKPEDAQRVYDFYQAYARENKYWLIEEATDEVVELLLARALEGGF